MHNNNTLDSSRHALLPTLQTRCLILAATLSLVLAGCGEQNQAIDTTFDSSDPMFSEPYVDLDEWRDEPVRHRYIHGGFNHTDTRFSFYFPPAEQYGGRFYQYITPVPDSETLSQGARGEDDRIGFSIASGAYFVETNGGGKGSSESPGGKSDPTVGAYRANAATARFSRAVANQLYGKGRAYGYAFGGSGGAFRTLAGMENTTGVWDGAVPYVIGSPMAMPNVFTVRTYAMRVLGDKQGRVADAVDAGSDKDPFTAIGLSDEQRAALTEATKLGFPLRGWHAWENLGLHAFALLFPAVVAMDPNYFTEFWSTPGYEGYQPTPSLKAALIDHTTTIRKLISAEEAIAMGLKIGHLAGRPHGLADDAWKANLGEHASNTPVAMQVTSAPAQDSLGADLKVTSGTAAGRALLMAKMEADIVLFHPGRTETLQQIQVGDKVHFDNRNFLAVQTYHRHQVPGRDFPVWNQFRDENGDPLYPQRPILLGPLMARGATGVAQTGQFKGKMIIVENLYDTEAYSWQADWYRNKARATYGDDLEQHLRVWMNDHANHGDKFNPIHANHLVSYVGILQQALRDLGAWVERGIEPAASTNYKIVDGQTLVPSSAARRRGIQPVVHLVANGGKRADVSAGETVQLVGSVALPQGGGKIVSAQWDIGDSGAFAIDGDIVDNGDDGVSVTLNHSFREPGTHFVTLRVASQREGDADTPYARVQNLDRARVVVSEKKAAEVAQSAPGK